MIANEQVSAIVVWRWQCRDRLNNVIWKQNKQNTYHRCIECCGSAKRYNAGRDGEKHNVEKEEDDDDDDNDDDDDDDDFHDDDDNDDDAAGGAGAGAGDDDDDNDDDDEDDDDDDDSKDEGEGEDGHDRPRT